MKLWKAVFATKHGAAHTGCRTLRQLQPTATHATLCLDVSFHSRFRKNLRTTLHFLHVLNMKQADGSKMTLTFC